MIALRDVTKVYEVSKQVAVTAVRGVSLNVERGKFVIITGRSGSGKTTLLNLAAGLVRPTCGEVCFEDTNLWSLTDREQSLLRNRKIGFVFQFPSLLPSLTVLENVALPMTFGTNHKQGTRHERAIQLLDMVGLSDKLPVYPRQLSAGQQQRVVIARALICQPDALLADEPTSNLDEQTEREIMDLFRDIHAKTGITIVLVTHTSQLVAYGTRALGMAGGVMVSDTPAPRS